MTLAHTFGTVFGGVDVAIVAVVNSHIGLIPFHYNSYQYCSKRQKSPRKEKKVQERWDVEKEFRIILFED